MKEVFPKTDPKEMLSLESLTTQEQGHRWIFVLERELDLWVAGIKDATLAKREAKEVPAHDWDDQIFDIRVNVRRQEDLIQRIKEKMKDLREN